MGFCSLSLCFLFTLSPIPIIACLVPLAFSSAPQWLPIKQPARHSRCRATKPLLRMTGLQLSTFITRLSINMTRIRPSFATGPRCVPDTHSGTFSRVACAFRLEWCLLIRPLLQAQFKLEAFGFAIADATKALELDPNYVKVRRYISCRRNNTYTPADGGCVRIYTEIGFFLGLLAPCPGLCCHS